MSAIKQSEKHVEAMLKAATERCGGTAVKMALTGARGFPDRLLLLPGRVVFVEVKGTGGKPDPMQEVWKRKIEALGLEWYLLDHTDDINAILRGPEALGVDPDLCTECTFDTENGYMENCPRCGGA
jgi:predicted Zn-ribbon and HTH transcriptional regulator